MRLQREFRRQNIRPNAASVHTTRKIVGKATLPKCNLSAHQNHNHLRTLIIPNRIDTKCMHNAAPIPSQPMHRATLSQAFTRGLGGFATRFSSQNKIPAQKITFSHQQSPFSSLSKSKVIHQMISSPAVQSKLGQTAVTHITKSTIAARPLQLSSWAKAHANFVQNETGPISLKSLLNFNNKRTFVAVPPPEPQNAATGIPMGDPNNLTERNYTRVSTTAGEFNDEILPVYETLDFTDAKTALKKKDSKTLVFNMSILYLCTIGAKLARYGPMILRFLDRLGLGALGYGVVRHTFFAQFCAGETEEKTLQVVQRLANYNIGSVLDYCIEDQGGDESAFDNNAGYILRTIELAEQHPDIHYSCLKVSSIVDAQLLQKASALLYHQRRNPNFQISWNELGVRRYGSLIEKRETPPPQFTAQEEESWNKLIERLDKLCKAAAASKKSLLIDAEWTHYQAAIDYLVYFFQKKYNQKSAVVMNTYQMYLRESYDRLKFDIEDAKKTGIVLGMKLVRGAYLASENDRAKKMAYQSPVFDEIDLTHESYHRGMKIVIQNIQNCQLLVATHKSASVKAAARMMYRYNLKPDDSRVEFAQLFGMAEIISNSLAQKGYRVSKYLPYGPVHEVIPYLSRRLEENHDFLGGTRIERRLFREELMRRWREDKAK